MSPLEKEINNLVKDILWAFDTEANPDSIMEYIKFRKELTLSKLTHIHVESDPEPIKEDNLGDEIIKILLKYRDVEISGLKAEREIRKILKEEVKKSLEKVNQHLLDVEIEGWRGGGKSGEMKHFVSVEEMTAFIDKELKRIDSI